jgi:predicted Rossmann fold flavoprotein
MVKKVKVPKTKVIKKEKKNISPDFSYDVVIIGGGPAGLMAACSAGMSGQKVLVVEKNDELGKKLLISGGGRCNITNANPNHREFVSKFGKKGDFLFSPFSIFGVQDTIKFFNNLGLKTKTEAGFRVFPESDNSFDVLDILVNQARKLGVEFKMSTEVAGFKADKKTKKISAIILLDGQEIIAKNFILTTGGLSHPETGSTGDGFKWLKEIGHKVAPANPSLVPIKIKETWLSELAGLVLEEVGISVLSSLAEPVLKKKGRVLFTHVGLTGPTILNMSKSIGELLDYAKPDSGEVKIVLDFFPGVGLDQMHAMVLNTFEINVNRKIKNLVFKEIPAKIFDLVLKQLDIDPDWEVNEIKRVERLALVEKFKKFELTVAGLLGFDKAIISSGGLDLNEVDFKTMGSKLYQNLFFAGDILDFDRPSGGFSLQLCWTTGYIAGKSAVAEIER